MKRLPDGDKLLVLTDIPETESRELARQADEKYRDRFVKHLLDLSVKAPEVLGLHGPRPHTTFELDVAFLFQNIFQAWKQLEEPRCFIEGRKLFEMEMAQCAKELPGLTRERKSKNGEKKMRYKFDVAALNKHFTGGNDDGGAPQYERVGDLKQMASDFIDELSSELGDEWEPDKDDDEDCSAEQSEKIDEFLMQAPLSVPRCEVAAVIASTSPEELANAWMGTAQYWPELREYWQKVIHATVSVMPVEQKEEFVQRVRDMQAEEEEEEEEEAPEEEEEEEEEEEQEQEEDEAAVREAAHLKEQQRRAQEKKKAKKRIQGDMSDNRLSKYQKAAAQNFGVAGTSS
jgi:hypothetical protein